jgi:4-amino-4-deoxy-L-arabinose transferase-like glycosyltransferase
MTWMLSRPLLTLFLVAGYLCSVGIFNHELWTPDEPRVAAIGRAMWETGSWAVPRLNGEPFLEKPPLYWWAQSAVYAVFGCATPGLARVPSALFAFGSLLLGYALGRRFFSASASLAGILVLATMSKFSVTAHWAVVDNALVLGVTGALACFAHAHPRPRPHRTALLAAMYLFLAVAFLSKGVVGIGIPVLGVAVYLVWTRELRDFVGWHLVAGAAFVATLVALWLWRVWLEAGAEGLEAFLVHNQLGRFFPDGLTYTGGHQRPIWYYFGTAPADMLPWTPFVLLAGVAARRSWAQLDERHRDGVRFCTAVSVSVFAALSLAGTKRGLYLVPVFPPVGLLVGAWMQGEAGSKTWELRLERGWERALLGAAALSAAGVVLAPARWPQGLAGALVLAAAWRALRVPPPTARPQRLLATTLLVALGAANLFITVQPFVDRYKSFVPFIEQVETRIPADRTVHAFAPDETTLGVIGFYTGRPVSVVDTAELKQLGRAEEVSWVVVKDRRARGGNYGRIEGAGIPHRLLSEEVIGRRRRMRILEVGGAGGPAHGPSGEGRR